MDSELEFTDMWRSGFYGASRERAFVLLPVNPLVNRLLGTLREPVELEAHGLGYEIMRSIDETHSIRSPEEMLVLSLIRRQDVDSVEVVSPSGEVEMVRTTSRPNAAADIALLLEEPYQRLSIIKKDGKTVHIEQEITVKPDKAAQ